MTPVDLRFRCMGTAMRIVGPDRARAAAVRRYLEDFDRRLSRFRPDSELSALNADPRAVVPASALLRAVIAAGLWAAQTTGGLVDPTLAGELERAGYAASMADAESQPLGAILAAAPPRAPARPDPHARWRRVEVDDEAGVIRRPPGLRLDSGGIGKGLAADAAALLLDGADRFVVDCGGDLRLGGPGAHERPFDVDVCHPLTGQVAHRFALARGGVATSGIDRRVWDGPDGPGHHLLDPSTGRPAWTGLVGATAVAPSALEADVLAKAAVLAGPEEGRALLRAHGGILFHEGGDVERVGLAVPRSVLRPFGAAV